MNLTESQKLLMRLLFVGKFLSRKNLAERLKLTSAAITLITNQLLDEHFISEAGVINGTRVGRKEQLITLNKNRFLSWGILIKNSFFYVSLTDFSGKLITSLKFASIEDAVEFIRNYLAMDFQFLGCDVIVEDDIMYKRLQNEEDPLTSCIRSLRKPYQVFYKINALSSIFYLFHPETKNFLVIDYGPEVNSSIFLNGKMLISSYGIKPDIGNMIVTKEMQYTLRDGIRYSSLVPESYQGHEKEYILAHPDILSLVLDRLALAIVNTDYLLSLDKIVVSGDLLSNRNVTLKLKNKIAVLNHDIADKVMLYDDYAFIEEKIGSLNTINEYLSLNK